MNRLYHPNSASAEPDDKLLPSGAKQHTIRASFGAAGDVVFWPVTPATDWFEFGRKVACALIEERALLGYQLSHAKGLIDREQMKVILREHFVRPAPVKDLDDKLWLLIQLVPEHADAELASAIFRCPVEQAENVLRSIRVDGAKLQTVVPNELPSGGSASGDADRTR